MSALDEYIKRELKCRHYGRYVDDFYIVGNSPHELLALILLIRNFLASRLGLKLHPRKIHLTSANRGVRFLGGVVKPYQRYIYAKSLSRLRSNLLSYYVVEIHIEYLLSKSRMLVILSIFIPGRLHSNHKESNISLSSILVL